MKSLKESLLDNIDSTLSTKTPYKELYPLPTTKDFKKNNLAKLHTIEWQCPELIKPYLNEIAGCLPDSSKQLVMVSTGLACYIDSYKCISVFLKDKDNFKTVQLDCIGDWVSNSIAETKKECINFFKTILDNPEYCFRKIIDYMKKAKQSKAQYGFADCITFEKLFK